MTAEEINQFELRSLYRDYKAIRSSLHQAAQRGVFSKRYPELTSALQEELRKGGYKIENSIYNAISYTKVSL